MAKLDLLLKPWDEAVWEYSLVFEGLADGDVWKRAHPRLLSIGELTGHAAYWEAELATAMGAEPAIQSALTDPAFRYYSTQVANPFSLDLSGEALMSEFKRIHDLVRAAVVELDPGESDPVVGKGDWTWGAVLRYRSFHAAYHAGQAYSVRHIFGHETADN